MRMLKIKVIPIEEGSVLCWKNYNIFKRIWYRLLNKELPYNTFGIVTDAIELTTAHGLNVALYTPVRKYSSKEIVKLKAICEEFANNWSLCIGTWEDTAKIINSIRSNTFTGNSTLSDSKYYKNIDLNVIEKEIDECIY